MDNIRQGGVCCVLCQILCTCWVTFGLRVVLGVDKVRVVSESNSCSLGLPYNVGAPDVVTHNDLIAIGTQGSRRLVPAPRAAVAVSLRRSARSHAPQM